MGQLALLARDPVLRLVVLLLFLLGGGIASIAPFQSLIARNVFGLGGWAYAAVLVAASLVGTVSAVAVGVLTDRRANRRAMAIAAAVLWLAGPALVVLAPTVPAFVLAHAVLLPFGGTLFGQLFVLARLTARRFPEDRRDGVQAAVRAAFTLPFVAILPLWSAAIAAGVPLVAVYPVTALAAAGGLVLVLRRWPKDEGIHRAEPSGMSVGAALAEMARPGIAARLLAVGAVKSGPALYMVLLGLVLTGAGHGEGDVALFAGLVAGFEVPVMLAAGWMLARLPRTGLIALAALVHAGFLAGFAFAGGSGLVWLLILPAALGAGIILSVPMGYLQDLLAHRPGAGGALIALHQLAGDALAAAAFAAGTAVGGYRTAALAGAAMVAAGGIALWRLDRGRRAGA
ncbi:MAG: MFS transporter [Paracoccaceae bacterium]